MHGGNRTETLTVAVAMRAAIATDPEGMPVGGSCALDVRAASDVFSTPDSHPAVFNKTNGVELLPLTEQNFAAAVVAEFPSGQVP